MSQWTFIDPNTLLPGDPWTSAKAQAAFENLEAVAEGAPGAPRINGRALDIYLGEGSASRSSSGTSTALTITDLDGAARLMVLASATANNAAATAQYRTSENNGSSWGGDNAILFSNEGTNRATTVIEVGGAVNAVQFRVRLSSGGLTASVSASFTVLLIEGDT